MNRVMTITDAMTDSKLFQQWFDSDSFDNWTVFLKALFGLRMAPRERRIFKQFTARENRKIQRYREAWLVVGRRGGKSLIAALVATYLACFEDHSKYLKPGEVGTVCCIAADRRQARTIMRYVKGFLDNVPMLAKLIDRETRDSVELSNHTIIEVHSCNFRSVRGYTLIACIADEIAFWRSEETSASPDSEVINALRPALATIPGSMLLCISSPYAKRGELYNNFRKHYGKSESNVLVWQAPTKAMNPALSKQVIDDAYESDPSSAMAEYGAEFRSDIESYISREAVEQSVIPGRIELPPASNIKYIAFVDPSGGSSDSMTCAVSHRHGDMLILDAIRECRPPFSPEAVVQEFSDFLKTFRISRVTGDRYGGEFPRELFRKHGIDYKTSELTKSDIYRELLAPLNSGRIELLDNSRLIAQLCGLERRTSRGGRDSIDHSPGGHDDVINSAAGALVAKAQKKKARIL